MVERLRAQAVFFSVIMVLSMVAVGGTAGAGVATVTDTVNEPVERFDAPDIDAVESVDDESVDLDGNDTDVEVHELTLVTGHTVDVIERGEHRDLTVDPGENAAELHVLEGPESTYVIPTDADLDVYSTELFNVDLLIDQGIGTEESDGVPVVVAYERTEGVGVESQGLDGFDPETEYERFDGAAGTVDPAAAETVSASATEAPGVERVYPDVEFETQIDDAVERTGVPDARDQYNVTGEGQTIAILDSGIDADHPDFGDRIVDRVDFSEEGLGDPRGHGTHVAGIAAGDGTESDGEFVGVAPDAEIMDVKVLGDDGTGAFSDVVAGMEYAIDNDADVISMSLGGPVLEDDPFGSVVADARDEDIPVVASAGNSGPGFETVGAPAAVEGAIAVGASDDDEFDFRYSSDGPAPISYAVKPEVTAPGTFITSTGSQDAGEAPYTEKTGTSMSAPHVSGLIALLEDAEGDLAVEAIEDRLVSTADFADDRGVYEQGGGEVSAPDAIASEIRVDGAVNGFGLYNESTVDGDVIGIENAGDEPVTLDVDATLRNEMNDEILEDQVSVNTTSVTVEPGETEHVAFEFDTEDAFGYNAGQVTFDGEDASYHAVFGFTKGLPVQIEKQGHEDTGSIENDGLWVFNDQGTLNELPGSPFADDPTHTVFLFTDEATINLWSWGQLEDAGGEPITVIREDVEVTPADNHVVLDESETVPRTVDTDQIAEHGPFQTEMHTLELAAVLEEISLSYGFLGGGADEIPTMYFSPVGEDDVTNVSTEYLFQPEVEGSGIDAEHAYHLMFPTHTVEGPEDVQVVDADSLATEEFTYHRSYGQSYGLSPFAYPAEDGFPDPILGVTLLQSIGDIDEQTWYRSPEVVEYSEGWSYFGLQVDRSESWEPDRVGFIPEEGETYQADFERDPILPMLYMDIDEDDQMTMSGQWHTDQSPQQFVRTDFNAPFGQWNEAAVYFDGNLVAAGLLPTFGFDFDAPVEPGTTVTVEMEGTVIETFRDASTHATYEVTHDPETTSTPPEVTRAAVHDIDLANEHRAGTVSITVDVEQHAGETLDVFEAYYAPDVDDGTPFDGDDDGWHAADVEHVEGDTYHVEFSVEDVGARPALGFAAIDKAGNFVEMVSHEAFEVASTPAIVNQGAPDRVDSGDDVTATVDVTELDRVKTGLHDASTVSEDDLTLFHGSTVNAFDQWRAFDEPQTVDDWPITVETADDTVGSVVLEHTFRDDHGDEVTVVTGPTAVYDEALVVGDSDDATVDTIQEAVDLAPEDTTIYVEDGTYEESVHVTTDGLSLTPIDEDADVTVEAPDDADTALLVDGAHDTHVDGVSIHANGGDGLVATDDAVDATVDAPTVTGVTVEDADTAVGFHHAAAAHVEEVTVTDSTTGVAVHGGEDAHLDGVYAEDTHTGIALDGVTDAETTDLSVMGATDGVVADDAGTVNATDVHVDGTEAGVLAAGETHLTLADATVMNATDAAVQTVGAHTDVHVSDFHAETVGIGVHAADTAHATVTDSTVVDADHGLRLDEGATADATLIEVSADIGVYADGADATATEIHHNDFAGSEQVAWVDTEDELDLRLNYVGDRAGGETIVEGTTTYDPFLTSAPEAIDFERTDIGTDLHLEAGDTYTVGVPGPTTQSVEEAFGAFDGAIYAFEDGEWELVTDGDLDALDAFAVVPEEDVRVTMTFEAEDGVPPGPGATDLEEGWNFVASPTYDGVETAFGQSTADIGLAMGLLERPHGQLGPAGELEGSHVFGSGEDPHVSAFEGTFVFVEDEGQQPALLTSDVTVEALYDQLGLEYEGHDDDGDSEYDSLATPPAIVN